MSARIPIADPDIGESAVDRVTAVLRDGRLADGDEVRAFEAAFADYCDRSHGVATANGTAALQVALEGLGVGEGDRVLTTPFSFIATANAIRLVGAEPVFADVEDETFNLDPAAVESTLEREDVDALLAVHLYGHPAPMEELTAIARRHDLAVIEDAAQAHGATLDGTPVGALGDVACFSFYPTKNMTTGEGGMVVTDDEAVAERARQFVNHGRTDTYEHARVGHNLRLTNVAAVGLEQLDRLETFVRTRRRNAAILDEHLADSELVAPAERPGARHAYHQYTVRCDDREALKDHLDDNGIDTAVYYPTPIHQQPAYDDVFSRHAVAERLAEEALSVPVHPGVSPAEADRVGDALARFY